MSDVNETVQIGFMSAAVATVLVVFIINMRGCYEISQEAQKTKQAMEQEAIKAGLTQDQYRRWERPTAPAQVEKP